MGRRSVKATHSRRGRSRGRWEGEGSRLKRAARGKLSGMARLPPWIRVRLAHNGDAAAVQQILESGRLNTVCQGAHCPNQHECYGRGTATFMILGDTCTRRCRFCAVGHGRPVPADDTEPARVAEAAARMALKHVVVTSVTRDDLPDGGAAFFAATIREIRQRLPQASIEVLIPDFKGALAPLHTVLEARPDVLNHNLETVRRLQFAIRPQADYERSLGVLRAAAQWRPAVKVKSGLMVGLGETDAEIEEALRDLRAAGVVFLTIGQYLAPSAAHAAVERYVTPDQFEVFGRLALEIGFAGVASAPLVRSSYRAERMLEPDGSCGKAAL
jgi:lipoic acid synthetase